MNTKSIEILVVWLILWCATMVSAAQAPLAFEQMTPAEQRVLMPFAEQWSKLDVPTQHNLRLGAQRWIGLSADQKREAARRFGAWQKLSNAERQQIRERYRAFRQMSPEQQKRLRQAYKHFKHLPPAQRARMRERFQRMSMQERRAFLEGWRAQRRLQRQREKADASRS